MRHGSLFSGIGGFDLAAQWMGWENVFHCEWNPFGQKVLSYYWPQAISYHDITKTDFSIHRGSIDILTGGFPCQPYSVAGNRKGKDDPRHLWPQMLRAIREVKPRYIIGENVNGIVNWGGGLVFHEVQTDLEAEGYEVLPALLPACGVNAPHRRDRIWFIAYTIGDGHQSGELRSSGCQKGTGKDLQEERERLRTNVGGISKPESSTDTNLHGCDNNEGTQGDNMAGELSEDHLKQREQRDGKTIGLGSKRFASNTGSTGREECNTANITDQSKQCAENDIKNWTPWPTVAPVCDGNDGFPYRLDTDSIFAGKSIRKGINIDRATYARWRNESIKAGGNAIVPQVVYQIFKAIQQFDDALAR